MTVVDATNAAASFRRPLLARARSSDIPAIAVVLDLHADDVRLQNTGRPRVVDGGVIDSHLAAVRETVDGDRLLHEGFDQVDLVHAGRSRGAHHRASTAQARLRAAQGKESPRAASRSARSRRWPPPRGRCRPCGREDGLAQGDGGRDHRDDRVHRGQDGGDGQLPGLDGNEVKAIAGGVEDTDQHEGQQQVAGAPGRSGRDDRDQDDGALHDAHRGKVGEDITRAELRDRHAEQADRRAAG